MSTNCEVYCETLPFERDDPRIEKFFLAIEASLPGTKIDCFIASSFMKWRPIKDRVQLFNETMDKDKVSLGHVITIYGNGRYNSDAVMVTLGRCGKYLFGEDEPNNLSLPTKDRMRKAWSCRIGISNQRLSTCLLLPQLLGAICAATESIDGIAGFDKNFGQLRRSTENVKRGIPCVGEDGKQFYKEWILEPEERSYDIFKKPVAGQMEDGFRFPLGLRWVNYWSDSVAKALNFPHPQLDQPLDGLYERIADQGWLVRLTKEPLDLDIPEHLERLNWAYSRFSMT